jgi:hypothetical protein
LFMEAFLSGVGFDNLIIQLERLLFVRTPVRRSVINQELICGQIRSVSATRCTSV